MIDSNTSVPVIPEKPVYKCYQVNIKFVITAEVAQVLLPVFSADSCSNSILSPVAYQKLACWKKAPFLKTMARICC